MRLAELVAFGGIWATLVIVPAAVEQLMIAVGLIE
jgi:hypothetical protein